MILIKFVIFVVCLIHFARAQLKEGDACFNRRHQKNGACSLIEDCKIVLDDLLERDLIPQECEIVHKKEQVVCCPDVKPKIIEDDMTGYRDSKTMCAKYAKTVFELRPGPVFGSPPINVSLCAHTGQPLIVGGEKAGPGEFPHMALIGFENTPMGPDDSSITWNCGGTLISERWILTAAHCVDDINYGPAKYVRLGEQDYSTKIDEVEIQEFTVIAWRKHPKYSQFQYDDIGLLKLNADAKFNKYVRPACLWTKREINAKKAIATGWGLTEDDGSPSSALQKVTLNLLHHSICSSFYKKEFRLPEGIDQDRQLCSGGIRGKDTCQGDSGGPLQIYADEDFYCMYYVVGVTSTGPSCSGIAPGLFTRVSAYVHWIEEIVWN